MSDTITEEVEAAVETKSTTKATPKKPKQKSYFSGKKLNRYMLDDEYSYIEHKPMDEGLFQSYQDLTSQIKLDRSGDRTEVDMKLGATRKFLLENLVVNWNLVDVDGDGLPFNHKALETLPPHVIGGLLQDIYKANPILGGEEDDEGKAQETK